MLLGGECWWGLPFIAQGSEAAIGQARCKSVGSGGAEGGARWKADRARVNQRSLRLGSPGGQEWAHRGLQQPAGFPPGTFLIRMDLAVRKARGRQR